MNRRSSRIFLTILILVLMLILSVNICSDEEKLRAFFTNATIYHDVKIDTKTQINIAGVDLLKYKNIEFYKYIITNENELILLGKEKPDMVDILISIDLLDKKNEKIIEKIDWEVAVRVSAISIKLLKLEKINQVNSLLIVSYHEDSSGNRVENTYEVIQVFVKDKNNNYILTRKEDIQASNYAYSVDSEKQDEYHAYAFLVNPEEQDKKLPGFKNINKVFLNDVNNDGFLDMLIWCKINLSRLEKEEDRDNFLFDSERLYVMYFDPETMSFGKRVPFDWN